ncbi:speriolin-like protein [Salarias fasciatus]|uniref:speriolin-like protein n=1 Tax=Salarias fasciatus TaxID=181472 RepID=UPI0011767E5E|nr:speriolin-like protein [Salarias fasciatus]
MEAKVLAETSDPEDSVPIFSAPLGDYTDESTRLLLTNLDESNFLKNLEGNNMNEQRTSSPLSFISLMLNSSQAYTEGHEMDSGQTEVSPGLKNQQRLLGEIAFQLDKRILLHVFQGQRRFYGFTVLNIHQKIIDVSTLPFTGKVDEGYQHFLSRRYAEVMATLQQLGFKAELHPLFTEFIVNTYGILKHKNSTLEADFNNPDFLREVVVSVTPAPLQKDMLIVLTCLCKMAEKDKNPLLLW